ncbi:ornithine cyclodeaminase family protein [Nocardia jiangxiensis]|uniref:Ornithine cyclodeaminase family protein n=1 Tax=Nocardia jiangxiensis TaxID=282685 RepID=A0ABW6RY92_9NOCA|nr:ornithine cyclodeaminase family protein [Nocardia jiangxiensis]
MESVAMPEGATLLLSDEQVRRACDMKTLVDTVQEVLREAAGPEVDLPPRADLGIEGTFFRVLPAIHGPAGVLGLKMFHGSFERGVRYLLLLCDIETGQTLGVLDAAYLTAARTGAVSGVATRHLARADADVVGVIGSGLEAETNLAAVASVRKIRRARVFSPRSARREAFAARMSAELDIDVVPVGAPSEAVAGADIVVVATNTGPGGAVALRAEWLEQGQHVISIGSTLPAIRELDAEVFRRAGKVVFDVPASTVAASSGDVSDWSADDPNRVTTVPTLTELLRGETPGRSGSDDITVFKSIGSAVQDLAAAVAVCRTARTAGLGTVVSGLASLKTF